VVAWSYTSHARISSSCRSTAATLVAVIILISSLCRGATPVRLAETLVHVLDGKAHGMIRDLNSGLNNLGDRLGRRRTKCSNAAQYHQQELTDRSTVARCRSAGRGTLGTRETTTLKLAEMSADLQAKHDQCGNEVLTRSCRRWRNRTRRAGVDPTTMRNASAQLAASMELLTRPPIPARADQRESHEPSKKDSRDQRDFRQRDGALAHREAQKKIDGSPATGEPAGAARRQALARAFGECSSRTWCATSSRNGYESQYTFNSKCARGLRAEVAAPTGWWRWMRNSPGKTTARMFEAACPNRALAAQRLFVRT